MHSQRPLLKDAQAQGTVSFLWQPKFLTSWHLRRDGMRVTYGDRHSINGCCNDNGEGKTTTRKAPSAGLRQRRRPKA